MYKKLALALSMNAVLMFLVTYAMIDRLDHMFFNINRVYMTLMMVAPMAVIMLSVMRSMYPNRQLNYLLIVAAIALFALSFALARTQTPVGNVQFLRSMVPHHSSAIVMCEEANLTDSEIISLCEEIVQTQEEEITQMRTILERLR